MSEAANAPAPEIQIIETREGRILRLQEEGQTMDLAVLWDATLGMVAPAISEADLAGKLGLKRSRALGDLAKRVFGKKFNEIHVCRSVRRTGAVSRESAVRWYTETQALQLIMRSSAPNASAMQVDIARVFALARRGLTPQRPVDAEAIAAKVVERVLGLLGGRLAAIEAKVGAPGPIGLVRGRGRPCLPADKKRGKTKFARLNLDEERLLERLSEQLLIPAADVLREGLRALERSQAEKLLRR